MFRLFQLCGFVVLASLRQSTSVRPARSMDDQADVMQGSSQPQLKSNATRVGYPPCDRTKSIAAQIPAVGCNCGAPMKPVDMSGGCHSVCGKRTAGKHFGDTLMHGVSGSSSTPELLSGLIKGIFYIGMHGVGALPDKDKLQVCVATFDFIHRKCPARKQKGCEMKANFERLPRCSGVWESLGQNNGEYVCKVIDWWDACCEDREPLPLEEQSCAGCGQDMYFCNCENIGDGVRPTHR
ncbi:unnamed protein product [Symbiodinium necroappetens]|uniref:Uncharacterized protein n=1 Tax=Symbiodinium necroappetens TaxID=1628268 RepID=A0A813B4T8_9DINO|nr:unnamed protein product [Symbiodinium necroappetens]